MANKLVGTVKDNKIPEQPNKSLLNGRPKKIRLTHRNKQKIRNASQSNLL